MSRDQRVAQHLPASSLLLPLFNLATTMQRCAATDLRNTHNIPDVSDTSFQIPSFHDHALLTEDTWELGIDAFDDESGMDHDPFTTPLHPASKRIEHAPLTLDELTPHSERVLMVEEPQQQQNDAVSSSRNNGEKETEWQKEKKTSVRHTLPKKGSVDDMFERRKRDTYQHMGIDLSSKSTARLRYDAEDIIQQRCDSNTPTHGNNLVAALNVPVQQQTSTSEHHVPDTRETSHKTKTKRVSLVRL